MSTNPGGRRWRRWRRVASSGALLAVLVTAGAVAAGEPDPGQRAWPEWVRELPELADDPQQARRLLTDSPPAAGAAAETYRLPRVSALVDEWLWFGDEAWLERVGTVLESAVAGSGDQPPDPRSGQILAALVGAVADGWHTTAPGGVPDPLRPALARVTATYAADVHWVMVTGEADPATQPGQRLPRVSARDFQLFLADLGRNESARDTVRAAAEDVAEAEYDYYLSGAGGQGDPIEAALRQASPGPARIFAALDMGASAHIFQTLGEDLIGVVNYQTGEMRAASRQRLRDQAMMACYRHLDPDTMPDYLREALLADGDEFTPIEQWYDDPGAPQRQAWEIYLSNEGAHLCPSLGLRATDPYEDTFREVRQSFLATR